MKKIIFLLFFTCTSLHSQNILKDEVDEFTGARMILTDYKKGKKIKLSDAVSTNNGLNFSVGYTKSDNSEIFVINLMLINPGNNHGCLSEYDGKISVLFENKNIYELQQVSNTDCGRTVMSGMYAFKELLTDPDYQREKFFMLSTNNIYKIRVDTSEGYIDYEIKETEKEFIKNSFKLILDTSKS